MIWLLWCSEDNGLPLLERSQRAEGIDRRFHHQGKLTEDAYHALEAYSSLGEIAKRIRTLKSHQQLRSANFLLELAVLNLAIGRTTETISLLENARRIRPGDLEISTNLSAAYLTRGLSDSSPDLRDIALALSIVDSTIGSSSDSCALLYNKALALERLALFSSAKAAWRRYLRMDLCSNWRVEARTHLKVLEKLDEREAWSVSLALLQKATTRQDYTKIREVVRRFPNQTRRYAEENCLGRWARLTLDGREDEASFILSEIRDIGRALLEIAGDHMVLDSLNAITRNASTDSKRNSLLEEGHRAFQNGLDLYLQDQVENSGYDFEIAERSLRGGGSPFYRWASLYLAIVAYNHSDFEGARAKLLALKSDPLLRQYPTLAARIQWIMGMCQLSAGNPAASISSYLEALELFRVVDAQDDVGVIHHLLAENFKYLGNDAKAWEHRYQALSAIPKILEARRLYAIFDETANAMMKQGVPRVALYFRDMVVKIALEHPEPRGIAFALIRRAETYLRLNEKERALTDLETARQLGDDIREESARQYVRARLDILNGEVGLEQNRPEALASVSRAIEYYRETGNTFPLTSLYRIRASIFRSLNKPQEQKQDLLGAIREFERERSYLSNEDQITYFMQAREAFDSLVTLEVEQGQSKNAFLHTEQARARVLLDKLLPNSLTVAKIAKSQASLASLEELTAGLPIGVKLLEYVVLKDRILIWLIGYRDSHLIALPVGEVELGTLVTDLGVISGKSGASYHAKLRKLYDLLILPVKAHIREGDLLVFVPDKILYAVPFAALTDPTGRFLIREFPIVTSPSASVYMQVIRGMRSVERHGSPKVLLVANPTSATQRLEGFPVLDGAESEARKIAGLYPHSSVSLLRREEASRESFLRAAGEVDIIHFGGHSVADVNFPALSRLVLASRQGEDGALYAFEIGGLSLRKTALVVLAACQTGSGAINNSEGLMSVGRAFMSAGVPAVVTSLWSVNERWSAPFFWEFHRHVRNGKNPAEALRLAQLRAIEGCSEPGGCVGRWAGFQMMGGWYGAGRKPGVELLTNSR